MAKDISHRTGPEHATVPGTTWHPRQSVFLRCSIPTVVHRTAPRIPRSGKLQCYLRHVSFSRWRNNELRLIISFVMSVCPSFHKEQLGSQCRVKCTLVQALRLCTDCTVHRRSRGITLPFLDHGTRRGERSAVYTRGRPGTHCTGGWLGVRAVLDRCGKSRPHRVSIPGPSSP
jgi:hypothetical protein